MPHQQGSETRQTGSARSDENVGGLAGIPLCSWWECDLIKPRQRMAISMKPFYIDMGTITKKLQGTSFMYWLTSKYAKLRK